MNLAEKIRCILNGENFEEDSVEKAGLPVGTIRGSYKKIADNPSQWEYLTQEMVFKNEGENERRAYLANKARLITGIKELSCDEKTFLPIGKKMLDQMSKEVKKRNVICKINKRRINSVDQNHIFRDKNTNANKALRVRALPFVLPIIEEYGVRGEKRITEDYEYQEIVGKADLTNRKGVKKRCAITVILRRSIKTGSQELRQLSVFVVDNKVIKSFATGTNRIDRKSPGLSQCTVLNDSHSTVYSGTVPHTNTHVNKKRVKKSTAFTPAKTKVDINITDITEGNKDEKLGQLAYTLETVLQGKIPKPVYIKPDGTEKLPNISLKFSCINPHRVTKAINTAAMILKSKVPVKGESFTYQCHKEMMDRINKELSALAHKTYIYVQEYFGLPEIELMSKANLNWKGKVIYSPETGKPITQKEWKTFVDNLEKFMNRNYSGLGKKWILSAEAMGRILDRMAQNQSYEEITKRGLTALKYKGKTYDWISDSVKNLKNTMGESLTRTQQARIEVASQSAAQRVTSVTDSVRNKIQQALIDGIRDGKSKSQVSQSLFDTCGSMNRDMQRIADSEYQMAMNRAYVAEEVYNSQEGEKVYFIRLEALDEHTCNKCKKLKDKIAVWSNTPLPNEKIKDQYATYAIWEGKTEGEAPIDILHPWCRGTWVRWNPPLLQGIKNN